MILIAGLGNPGKKYEKTRHNIGFAVIDNLAKKYNWPVFKLNEKFNADISEGEFSGQKIILAKPQTFMNLSGNALLKITKNYKLGAENLILVHDDIDLPLGKIKIVKNRGAAGHKGVESIIKSLGTKNFIRFRIGIKPKQYRRPVYDTEKFVLQKFTKQEEKIIKEAVVKTAEAIEYSLKEGLEKAMNRYNC